MTQSQMTVDVLIAGTGASGLTAAVTARKLGLNVLVVEKEALIGGTTATSGGVLWIPGNHHSAALKNGSTQEKEIQHARNYLLKEVGNYADQERIDTYLTTGPEMVKFLEEQSEVKFYGMDYPDYRSEIAESSTFRSVGTVDYQVKDFGPRIKSLKNQLPQTMFFGFAFGSSVEMIQFMRAGRSISALGYVIRKLSKHFLHVLRYGEGQQIVRGRALVGRLARTLFDLETPIWLSSPIERLVTENGEVKGADVRTANGVVRVNARRGVVLACGGYPNDPARRAATFPQPAAARDQRYPVPTGNTGDGIRLAESVGGRFNGEVAQVAPWMPVSVVPGTTDFKGVWPHLVERPKPGFMCVLKNGKRFVDESASYQDFVPALIKACANEERASCWLIGDAAAVGKWGIGRVRPFPIPHGAYIRNGYLRRGATLDDLAAQCGIDPTGLKQTVERFNADAAKGTDTEFGRGGRLYDKYQGDPQHGPNACLGPIEKGPFYAVKIEPGLIGTFAGLRTDKFARVLDTEGRPIKSLYAVGNDQASVFGGTYPGAGATLGPAMTFAYIAARHLAETAP